MQASKSGSDRALILLITAPNTTYLEKRASYSRAGVQAPGVSFTHETASWRAGVQSNDLNSNIYRIVSP